jgi:uncharacterized protein (DUF305 family)
MRPPIRRVAPIGAIMLVIALVAATAFLAVAQDGSKSGPNICSASAGNVGGEGPYLVENDSAMKRMMNDMAIAPIGDVDLDFVAMMVPHHQGAIDMAVAVLRYGRNQQIRRLAQEIIVTQQQEITAMRLAVGLAMPTFLPALTQSQPLSGASYAKARD